MLAVAGALVWFVFVPNARPALQDGERYGVDVSNHQGVIDWKAVAADEIKFAYIKASEGGDFVDQSFAANWAGARDAGLQRGAYHFFTLCKPGAEQARNFLTVAPPERSALAPAVDLELSGNCSDRPPPEQVGAEVRAFIDAVEAAWGRPVLVYIRNDWQKRYPGTDFDRPEWVFRLLVRPSEKDWIVWQIHGFAKVDGVKGRVDLNIMRPAPAPA